MRKAVSEPICICPASTRWAPNQSTATLDTFRINITIGNIDAISRPTEVWVSVSSALALANRAVSYGSRTNARTTRMPVICSRSTRLTVSIRACMTRNSGRILLIDQPDRAGQQRARPRRPARTGRRPRAGP